MRLSWSAALRWIGPLLLVGCSVRVPFADGWLFTTERPQLPRAEDCQRCHGEIYEEWRASPHAQAWTADPFVAVTGDHAATDCLGCHAPAPLGSEGEVWLRTDHVEEGVTCISCHLSADPLARALTMRGPHERTSPVDVHPIVADPLFRRAELCGTCHEGVLEQWRDSPEPSDGSEKETCQECHMPETRRTMESYDPDRPYSAALVALGREVEGRRHRFAVPDDPWEEIEVRLEAARGSKPVRVLVSNRLPHKLPTGTYGHRLVRLRLLWGDGEASALVRADLGEAIEPGTTRVFEFPDAPRGVGASAVLERRDPRTGTFLRIAPEPPAELAEDATP